MTGTVLMRYTNFHVRIAQNYKFECDSENWQRGNLLQDKTNTEPTSSGFK